MYFILLFSSSVTACWPLLEWVVWLKMKPQCPPARQKCPLCLKDKGILKSSGHSSYTFLADSKWYYGDSYFTYQMDSFNLKRMDFDITENTHESLYFFLLNCMNLQKEKVIGTHLLLNWSQCRCAYCVYVCVYALK